MMSDLAEHYASPWRRPCRTCAWIAALSSSDVAFLEARLAEFGTIAALHQAAQRCGLDVGYSSFKACLRYHKDRRP
jgi:hypothetical protein